MPDFRWLFENLPQPALVLAPDPPRFTITGINNVCLARWGMERESCIGRGLFEGFAARLSGHPESLRASLERALATGLPDRMPVQKTESRRPDGETEDRYWSPFSAPLFADGRIASIVHRVEDVTATVREQQRAVEALKLSQARVSSVLNGIGEGFVLLDREFRILDINAEGLRIDGRPAAELVGRTHWEAWPASAGTAIEAAYRRVMAERVQLDIEHHYVGEGHDLWLALRLYPVEEGVAAFYRDVTARWRTEQRLRISEESLRLATDAAEIGTWDLDLATDILVWSDRTKAMFGISPDMPCDMNDFYSGLHPDDYPATAAAFASALDPAMRATYDVEYRTIGKEDGIIRWVAAKGRGLFDEGGRCIRAIGITIDITRRKNAEARQAFLLNLADQLRILANPETIMCAAARALGRHLGASRVGYGEIGPDGEEISFTAEYLDGAEPLAGNLSLASFGAGLAADLRLGLTVARDDLLRDGRAPEAGFETIGARSVIIAPVIIDLRLRSLLCIGQRQARTWAADDVSLTREVAGRIWEAVERARSQDALRELNETLERRVEERTAELQHAEAALRQVQKMEAVGQLTGGIAHDFNNMLTGISGALELLESRLEAGRTDDMRRYISAAVTASQRAASLTQRLLAFARRQPLDPKRVQVERLVPEMDELLRRSLGPAIALEIVMAPALWPILCDPNQLESAILNLAINARDAMPQGGRLVIEAANAELDQAYSRMQGGEVKPGQYVAISVTDTGSGMSKDLMGKVFEPFFTTKPIGQGTGLGLSMLYGFIRQSDGHVHLYSEEGQGTTFKLYFPRYWSRIEEEGAEKPASAAGPALGEGRTVLVVEDEATVRMLITETLEDLGHRTIEAADGPSGLGMLQSGRHIDLLITDVGLPGLNGRQVADAGRLVRPGLKVLFITGYAHNAAVGQGEALEAGMEIMTKPFALNDLAARVRSMLEG